MKNNIEEKKQKDQNKITIKFKILIIVGVTVALAIVGIILYETIQNKKIKEKESFHLVLPEKPIIYLYPERDTKLSVKLGKPNNITCSYPKYKDGWNVIAHPDGTLVDLNTGRKLYSLYWEGIDNIDINLEEGFIVEGADTLEFLEEKLSLLGLNEIESEEFIVYWLPKLQGNNYNFIRFATLEEINEIMPLEFSVEPDTIIRVLMQYKPLEKYIEVNKQKLETPKRTGFIAVEWGGIEIK